MPRRLSFDHLLSPLRLLPVAFLLCGVASSLATPARADAGWTEEKELAQIRQRIAENGWHWQAGHTGVSAVPPEERSGYLGYIPLPDSVLRARATGVLVPLPTRDLPARWDWREHNGVTPVKNQGGCGSCWAFAATASLESTYKIVNGTQQLFSEQQCLSCNDADYGCDGGNSIACYDLWTCYGAVANTCMPYQGNDAVPCIHDECEVKARLLGSEYVMPSADAWKSAILIHPITVTLYASNEMFGYSGGCYAGPAGETNHEVLCIGWDDAACDGQGAWLIKNSWGSGWGEGGFGWIQYGTCSIGGSSYLIDYQPFPQANVAYSSHQILDGGDGHLDPGESAQIAVTLTNYGIGSATGISAILRSLTPGVTVVDSVATFPNAGSWVASPSQAPHFSVVADGGLTPRTLITFQLEVLCDQVPSQISTFYDFVSTMTTIYSTNFDANDTGWTHGSSIGWDDWRYGTPRNVGNQLDPKYAYSGTKVYGNDLNEAGTEDDGLYLNSTTNYLDSPAFDCSNRTGVMLTFKRWLTAGESPLDVARIKVNNWEVWRNSNLHNHIDGAWTPFVLDIHERADGNAAVTIRFEMISNPHMPFGGWTIDDFKLVSSNNPVSAPTADPRMEDFSITSSPNPFRGTAGIHLTLPLASADARVQVFDAAGRLVRTIHEGSLERGAYRFLWTGQDDSGRDVAAGTYFCLARANGRTATARLIRTE